MRCSVFGEYIYTQCTVYYQQVSVGLTHGIRRSRDLDRLAILHEELGKLVLLETSDNAGPPMLVFQTIENFSGSSINWGY
jgi:hypothetical protein